MCKGRRPTVLRSCPPQPPGDIPPRRDAAPPPDVAADQRPPLPTVGRTPSHRPRPTDRNASCPSPDRRANPSPSSMHAGDAAEHHGATYGTCRAGRTARAVVAAPPRPEERTGPDPVARGHPVGRRRIGAVRRLKQPRGQGPWRTGPRPDAPSPPTEAQTSSCFTEPPSRPAGRRRPSASARQTVQIARDHNPNKGSGGPKPSCGALFRRLFLGRLKCPAHRPQDGSDGRTPRAQPLVGSSTCYDYESFPSGRAGPFQPSIPFDP
jgi:hypothetical protein